MITGTHNTFSCFPNTLMIRNQAWQEMLMERVKRSFSGEIPSGT